MITLKDFFASTGLQAFILLHKIISVVVVVAVAAAVVVVVVAL